MKNKTIKETLNKFEENMHAVDQITKIGSDIGEITIELLTALRKDSENLSGFLPYKEKLDRVMGEINKIKDHAQLKKKYNIIYNQALVLLVSNVESYFNDLAVTIMNHYNELVDWPKEDKKIIFEVGILKYKFPTIGEIIVDSISNEINFQDLQSTIRFFKDYLSIDLNLDDNLKEKIIKYHALRHTIIHNFSKIDEIFLKQVRDTNFAKTYNMNQSVRLEEIDFIEAKECFASLTKEVASSVIEKMVDLYGSEFVDANES